MTNLIVNEENAVVKPKTGQGGSFLPDGANEGLGFDYSKPQYQVRLQPDLAATAFRSKQVSILITWLRLRSICFWGSGFLDYQVAIREISTVFSMAPRSAIRALKQGDGKLWAITDIKGKAAPEGRTTVVLQGVKAACLYFGIAKLTDIHWRKLPADKFRGMARARAEVYASIAKPAGIQGNPMSRETLTTMTGLHKVQQRRYDILAGVKRTPAYAPSERQEIHSQLKGTRYVSKRLPNIYHSQQQPSAKGVLKQVNRALCAVAPRGSSMLDKAQVLSKRYFSSSKRIVKALKARGGGEGYYLVRNSQRVIPGRLEWALVSL